MSRTALLTTTVLLFAGAIAPVPVTAGKKKTISVVYVAAGDSDDAALPTLDGDVWRSEGDGYRVALRQLDTKERQAFIVQRTGARTDPFANRPDEPEGFLTFLLELENRGNGTLLFHPQNAWLVPPSGLSEYPIDLATISMTFRSFEREMPPAYEGIAKALYEGEQMLAPGERSSGLLVYKKPSQRMKRFTVELQLSLPSGEVASIRAPYRRAKE